jgi:peptidylprolyl isomerase
MPPVDRRVQILIGFAVVLAIAVGAVLIGQSGGDDEGGGGGVGDCTAEGSGEKPAVEVAGTEPPAELETEDLEVGDGPEAKLGDSITVNYVGVLFDDCTQFDASYDSGQPATFPLEEGGLIDGWVQGIPGMKVGGRRQLTIPAELAYGEAGQPPDIPPNAALVFVIDLVSLK